MASAFELSPAADENPVADDGSGYSRAAAILSVPPAAVICGSTPIVVASVPAKKFRPPTPSSPTPEALTPFTDSIAGGERIDAVDALFQQHVAAVDQALQLSAAEIDWNGVCARGQDVGDDPQVGRDRAGDCADGDRTRGASDVGGQHELAGTVQAGRDGATHRSIDRRDRQLGGGGNRRECHGDAIDDDRAAEASGCAGEYGATAANGRRGRIGPLDLREVACHRVGDHRMDKLLIDELVVAHVDAQLAVPRLDNIDLDQLAQRIHEHVALVAQVVGVHARGLNL